MGDFRRETSIEAVGGGRWRTRVSAAWNIGGNPNGGYLLTPVLRAMHELAGHPDPISVTTHFLRPGRADAPGEVTAELMRSGRKTATATGTLVQDGKTRVSVTAVFGDLTATVGAQDELTLAPPDLPPVEECVDRGGLDQGVELALLSRVDIRVHPDHARPGASDRAILEGWIRFADRTEPTSMALPFFADAFPPSLYSLFGHVGWVPTIELTVHPRRRPAPGWLRARLECDDLQRGRMIESGSLWDSTGALVVRSRQIGLLLGR